MQLGLNVRVKKACLLLQNSSNIMREKLIAAKKSLKIKVKYQK